MGEIRPTPDVPEVVIDSATRKPAVKPATPDLLISNIQFNDARVPIEFLAQLLFEQIGGKEIITIARNDIINGQKISYGLIANSSNLAQAYNPINIFKVPGTSAEFFDNFSIKFEQSVPDIGTGPLSLYIGEENSFNCSGFPVLNRVDDSVIECFNTFGAAESFIKNQNLRRPIVYSEPETGNLIVDVVNLKRNDRVEIEVLIAGSLENDTIY
jgi:hypothetical protein